MTFEISKERISFPQPGRLIGDSDVFQLLDRKMKYLNVLEEGVSEVFTFAEDLPQESVLFYPKLPKVFFSRTYSRIPYMELLRVQHDHSEIGYYYHPFGFHPAQWQTSVVIEKDGFTFTFDNFFGAPNGPAGLFEFTLYWMVYDVDYLGDVL